MPVNPACWWTNLESYSVGVLSAWPCAIHPHMHLCLQGTNICLSISMLVFCSLFFKQLDEADHALKILALFKGSVVHLLTQDLIGSIHYIQRNAKLRAHCFCRPSDAPLTALKLWISFWNQYPHAVLYISLWHHMQTMDKRQTNLCVCKLSTSESFDKFWDNDRKQAHHTWILIQYFWTCASEEVLSRRNFSIIPSLMRCWAHSGCVHILPNENKATFMGSSLTGKPPLAPKGVVATCRRAYNIALSFQVASEFSIISSAIDRNDWTQLLGWKNKLHGSISRQVVPDGAIKRGLTLFCEKRNREAAGLSVYICLKTFSG